MNKIEKFLLKLSKKNHSALLKILADIRDLKIDKYNVKPLTGAKGVFRLRKGDIRIVFFKQNGHGILMDVNFRKDIYKNI